MAGTNLLTDQKSILWSLQNQVSAVFKIFNLRMLQTHIPNKEVQEGVLEYSRVYKMLVYHPFFPGLSQTFDGNQSCYPHGLKIKK